VSSLDGVDGPLSDLERQLEAGEVAVAVYGLGKMGLPLAAAIADETGAVTGVDIDESVVRAVAAGDCPVGREPGLSPLVAETVAGGSLTATTDGQAAAEDATVHVVIVPTTVHPDGVPDLSALRSVVETIGTGLVPGDLVLVESTVPPRTCEDILVPLLARTSGLDPETFGVAFCPERTASGRALTDIRGAYPKVVGGVDDASTEAAARFYERLTDNEVLTVADATTAEAIKVFEGVYRDVNIALANELARFATDLEVDVRQAIEIANTQPYCDLHDPGIGVGGHCVPYYPEFLASTFGRPAPLIRAARDVNDGMPLLAVRMLRQALAERSVDMVGADVLLLGVAYRPGVAEVRKSPALPIANRLADLGASVSAVDPVVDDMSAFPVAQVPLSAVEDARYDGVVLVTAHEEFEDIDWAAMGDTVLVDGRGVVNPDAVPGRVLTLGDGR
jgi:UDP-N-acetyl-D-mannosaminuronic acid dehydrogenase